MAAQEQALNTKSTDHHARQEPMCRLCNDNPETRQHIIPGWNMQAHKAYSERHQVADIVYRSICAEYGLEVPGSNEAAPPKVLEKR